MIPPVKELRDILFDEENCIEFLFSNEILYNQKRCDICNSFYKRKKKLFCCRNESCGKSVSIFKDSFFAKSRLKCSEILFIGYLWLSGSSSKVIKNLTGHSQHTITDFISFYDQLVASNIDADDTRIGGQGIIVEIDESKMGKRKYNRGHRVDGVWIVGGVERTTERRCFALSVMDRTAETLRAIISSHVNPGSIVYTDMWRGYQDLESLGLIHQTVNHSEHFRDPVTGVHTNTVEGMWNGVKMNVPARKGMDEKLLTFIWKRKHSANLWNGLIDALKNTAYTD